MANTERSTRPSFLRRMLAGVLWVSAAAAALPGLFRSYRGGAGERTRPEIEFERKDIDAHAVTLAAVGILLITWALVGILYVVFMHFVHTPGAGGPMAARSAEERVPLPAEPRLQTSPPRDYEQVRAAAMAQLNSYGWADRAKGMVTIPIEQAMKLTAQRGIPPQQAPPGMFFAPRAGNRLTGFEHIVEGTSK
jgi:hypothetical protein